MTTHHFHKDFDPIQRELTSNGELFYKESKRFTPIGIRKNVKKDGPLYHGTKADLQIGDVIQINLNYSRLSRMMKKISS